MIIRSTVKMLAVLAGMLLIGGVECWNLSSGDAMARQETDAPIICRGATDRAAGEKDEIKEGAGPQADAANAGKAKAQLEQFKGTWKVVYSEGEPPEVKLPNGMKLQKPAFFLIDEHRLTWDNGNPDDPARLVHLPLRYPHEDWWPIDLPFESIEISHDDAFPQADTVQGRYRFDEDRLWIRWRLGDTPSIVPIAFSVKRDFIVILQRVDGNDPRAASKQKAAETADLQSLQGRWRITKVEGAQDNNNRVGHDFIFQGGGLKIPWRDSNDRVRSFGPVLLTAGVDPKQIIYFNDEALCTFSGIYRLEKDHLEFCWRIDDRKQDQKQVRKDERPNKFEVAKDAKTTQLILLERVNAVEPTVAERKARIIDLQKARIAALQDQFLGEYVRLQAGKSSLDEIFEALDNLRDAQWALAADKETRIRIAESCVQVLLELESFRKTEVKNGKSTAHEVFEVKARRLMAEILLEKEKGRKS